MAAQRSIAAASRQKERASRNRQAWFLVRIFAIVILLWAVVHFSLHGHKAAATAASLPRVAMPAQDQPSPPEDLTDERAVNLITQHDTFKYPVRLDFPVTFRRFAYDSITTNHPALAAAIRNQLATLDPLPTENMPDTQIINVVFTKVGSDLLKPRQGRGYGGIVNIIDIGRPRLERIVKIDGVGMTRLVTFSWTYESEAAPELMESSSLEGTAYMMFEYGQWKVKDVNIVAPKDARRMTSPNDLPGL